MVAVRKSSHPEAEAGSREQCLGFSTSSFGASSIPTPESPGHWEVWDQAKGEVRHLRRRCSWRREMERGWHGQDKPTEVRRGCVCGGGDKQEDLEGVVTGAPRPKGCQRQAFQALPRACLPNSFPPSGHSSGPDSALSPCSRQKGGWERLGRLLEHPVLTLCSTGDPVLSVP